MNAREEWRETRTYLDAHRHPIATAAARRYPDVARVPGTRALTRPGWLPAAPVGLAGIRLAWTPDPPAPAVTGPAYARTLAALAPPGSWPTAPRTGSSPRPAWRG